MCSAGDGWWLSHTPRESNTAADRWAAKARRESLTNESPRVLHDELWDRWKSGCWDGKCLWFLTMDGSVVGERAGSAALLWHATGSGSVQMVAATLCHMHGVTSFIAECVALLNALTLMQYHRPSPAAGWYSDIVASLGVNVSVPSCTGVNPDATLFA